MTSVNAMGIDDARDEVGLPVPSCSDCEQRSWPPRRFCPHCGGRNVTLREHAGLGEVYSHTVVRKNGHPDAQPTPYALAYVTLDGGPTVFGLLLDVDPESLSVGLRVALIRPPAPGSDAPLVFGLAPAEQDGS